MVEKFWCIIYIHSLHKFYQLQWKSQIFQIKTKHQTYISLYNITELSHTHSNKLIWKLYKLKKSEKKVIKRPLKNQWFLTQIVSPKFQKALITMMMKLIDVFSVDWSLISTSSIKKDDWEFSNQTTATVRRCCLWWYEHFLYSNNELLTTNTQSMTRRLSKQLRSVQHSGVFRQVSCSTMKDVIQNSLKVTEVFLVECCCTFSQV